MEAYSKGIHSTCDVSKTDQLLKFSHSLEGLQTIGQEGQHMEVKCHHFHKLFKHLPFSDGSISTVIPLTILTTQLVATYIGNIHIIYS